MNEMVYTILLRSLKHSEGLLSELTTDLGYEAYLGVHMARLNVETLLRVEERNTLLNHVTGQREAA